MKKNLETTLAVLESNSDERVWICRNCGREFRPGNEEPSCPNGHGDNVVDPKADLSREDLDNLENGKPAI